MDVIENPPDACYCYSIPFPEHINDQNHESCFERILLRDTRNLKSDFVLSLQADHIQVLRLALGRSLACARNSAVKGINMLYYLFVHCNIQSLKHFIEVKTGQ